MVSKEDAKVEIQTLMDKYKRLSVSCKIKEFNEERTKNEFIEPLFKYLGWDMRNEFNDDEVTKEVHVSKGRADYAFRINGIPKFFVEAKALKIDLDNPVLAEQAINYAYLKSTTWAILTDFESIKIFNSEWKARSLSEARFIEIKWNEYINRFEELWLLSKEAIINGELDKYAERVGKKAKKTPIDKQLLFEMTKWRELLSKDITKHNIDKKLEQEELDEAVQRILDRLIFIRKCEDKNIETAELRSRLRIHEDKHKGKLVRELNEIFAYFRHNYNSGLFGKDESDIHLCEQLEISNDVLRTVINGLYTTPDRIIYYDFSAIDADVLGNIYEQYLSYILNKTDKRAKLKSDLAHRKVQGIYYTPTYIVDYIVKNTLGELIKNKKPERVDDIKILDPACGSGSFLIKAFDEMDKFYKKKTGVDSFIRKSKILTDNIYGVDLDDKAVEIARLNLLMKTTEKRHKLPVLRENIKCGNSVIDAPEYAGEKAFRWKEQFKSIIDDNGFDVIIGNPPYVRQEELLKFKKYFETNYEVYHSMADLFVYFFEKELKLLKENGYFGMIVSNKWLKAGYGNALRKFLNKYWIEQFIDFGDLKVFQDAITYPCIIIIRNIQKPNPKIKVCKVKTLNFGSLPEYVNSNSFLVDQKLLDDRGWDLENKQIINLLNRLRNNFVPIKDYIDDKVYFGIKTGLTKAFLIDENTYKELVRKDSKSAEIIKPFLTGKEVQRYRILPRNKYLILTKIGVDINRYPAIHEWLSKFRKELEKRWDKGNYWYELRACDYYDLFEKPKIIYGIITTKPRFTLDMKGNYANNANFIIPTSDKHLLGVLNSRLGWFLIKNTCTQIMGGYQLIWKYFGNVPITSKKSEKLTELVDRMLEFNEKLNMIGDKKTDERSKIEENIKIIDGKIDEIVYKLYNISEDEKKIIENSM